MRSAKEVLERVLRIPADGSGFEAESAGRGLDAAIYQQFFAVGGHLDGHLAGFQELVGSGEHGLVDISEALESGICRGEGGADGKGSEDTCHTVGVGDAHGVAVLVDARVADEVCGDDLFIQG